MTQKRLKFAGPKPLNEPRRRSHQSHKAFAIASSDRYGSQVPKYALVVQRAVMLKLIFRLHRRMCFSIWGSLQLRVPPLPKLDSVESDGKQQDEALHDPLPVRNNAEQI